MRQPAHQRSESGQAAVETAIVLPVMVFMLLGVLQMTLAYQARLVNEYAAFKVARAASVYRLDCGRMVNAGLMALVPTIGRTGTGTYQQRFLGAARELLSDNKPPFAGISMPLIRVRYRVSGNPSRTFDHQLAPGDEPLKVHVRVSYFFEYRIPFANWIISRVWLASQTGQAWASGADPLTPVRRTPGVVAPANETALDVNIVQDAIRQNYFTTPLVSSWSMRMMSDPLPGTRLPEGRCQ
ncbi:MAG TPA: TadE family protein [Hyalangium sp.]|nr:TadE family protein [Hyalangium sp.]